MGGKLSNFVAVTVLGLVAPLGGCAKQASAPPRPPVPGAPEPPAAAAPTPAAAEPPATANEVAPSASGGRTLTVAGLAFDVPEGWAEDKPGVQMRLAQYSLPGEVGPAVLAVYCFGVGQGGSTEDNIQRWVGQFQAPNHPGQPAPSRTYGFARDGLTCTVVRAQGTYAPGTMGAPQASGPQSYADHALYGLIVEGGPKGTVFIKVTGPQATLDAHGVALEAFAGGVRLAP